MKTILQGLEEVTPPLAADAPVEGRGFILTGYLG